MIPGDVEVCLKEIVLSSYIYYDVNYSNDDYSVDSDLDFYKMTIKKLTN